jgi:chromate transporter
MHDVPDADGPSAAHAPRSIAELLGAFTRLALQGFGGVMPIAQRELVERRRWLTREQFLELLSIAQVLPGPNIVNLALVFGDRSFGVPGALAALAGLLCAPLAIVIALAMLYTRLASFPIAVHALRGMGAVAAGLIFATGVKLLPALRRSKLGSPVAYGLVVVTFVSVGLLGVPLIRVLAALGLLACAWAWRRSGRP